jgi:tetratricopeptide (TPR) repeat protein
MSPFFLEHTIALRYWFVAVLTLASAQYSQVAQALDAQEVYARASTSVVIVETFELDPSSFDSFDLKAQGSPKLRYKTKPNRQGSGVVVAKDEVITNCHVTRGSGKIEVVHRGQRYQADRSYSDPERDLCQLFVKGLGLPGARIGRSQNIHPGEGVFAVGAPLGLELTISNGIISGIRIDAGHRYLQTTAAISPGSSGGGLFNANAELIGITTSQIRDGQALNFAIPIEWLSELAGRAAQRRQKWKAAGGSELSESAMLASIGRDWDSLLKSATRLVELDPYDSGYWIYLGSAYAHRDDRSRATQAFTRAIALDPSVNNWREIANGYLTMGFSFVDGAVHTDKKMLASARKAMDQALGLAPEDAQNWSLSGEINLRLGNRDQAIRDLNEAIRIQPNDSGPWMILKDVYWEQGNRDNAAYAARRAMAVNPDSWKVRLLVFAMADIVGDESLRREAYAGLKRLNPEEARRYETKMRQ